MLGNRPPQVDGAQRARRNRVFSERHTIRALVQLLPFFVQSRRPELIATGKYAGRG